MTILGMWLFLDRKVYRRFHDVIVPSSNGTSQIDHVLISPFGVFVIETKNIRGWIFGSENQVNWTQSLYGKKYSFQNPLHQNFRHTQCLGRYLDVNHAVLHSIVFFIGDGTLKSPMPSNVLVSGLSSYIRSFDNVLCSPEEVQRIVSAIEGLKNDRSLTHKSHVQSLQQRHNSVEMCPKCGSQLVERIAKKGAYAGKSFLGCSRFPRCRYTKTL